MFHRLQPDRVLDTVRALTPNQLNKKGISLVLTDLDNTLTDYRTLCPDEKTRAWLTDLRDAGIRVVVLSNNRRPERVRSFCEPLGLTFRSRSRKPRPDALLDAMKDAGAAPAETLMVGDQIFTDILAAKRAGVTAVLVRPYHMGFWHRLRRIAEYPFILSCPARE